jgi:predicted transglutaminase-like protease
MKRYKNVYYLYLLTILFITLSGFGQMPIFKRYYIADIPGLGWLARFYVTHYVHYICAALIIGITSYAAAGYLLSAKNKLKLTVTGYLRAALISGLIATGILLVIRNFEGYIFSHNLIIFLDLSHLALVMLFLFISLYCFVFKKKWAVGSGINERNSTF